MSKYKPKKEKKKKITPEARKYKTNNTLGAPKTKCRFCRKWVSFGNAWNCCYSDKFNTVADFRAGRMKVEPVQESKQITETTEIVPDGDS